MKDWRRGVKRPLALPAPTANAPARRGAPDPGPGTAGRPRKGIPRRPKPSHWPLWLVLGLGLPIGLLIVATVGLAVALRLGPVEVDFLKGSLQAAIDRQIAPLKADVGAASLHYDAENGGLALRLSGVDLAGADGKPAASIALATVELDWSSLLSGSFTARALTLEEPQFRLRYNPARGLELATAKLSAPGSAADTTGWGTITEEPSPVAASNAAVTASPEGGQDVVATIRAVLAGAATPTGGTLNMATLRIRSGRLNVEGLGRVTPWRIPEYDLSLDQREGRGILVGSGHIIGPSGKTHATISAEQLAGAPDLKLTVTMDRMVPADFANLSPALGPLAAALLPVGGEASLDFGASGQLDRLDMNIGLGAGLLDVGGACAESFRLDRGGAHIRYVRGTGRIDLLPSNLRSNGSGATVSGAAQVSKDADGTDHWQYAVAFADAAVADPAHGLGAMAIDNWSAKGTFTPSSGEAVLERMSLDSGGTKIAMAGRISAQGLAMDTRVTGAPFGMVLRLWPSCFQSYARNWVLTNVQSGTILKGRMQLNLDAAGLERLKSDGKLPDEAASAEFEMADIAFGYAEGLPAVLATRGKLQFSGRKLTAQIPEAASQMPSGRVLTLTNAHYEVADFLDPSPRGRITLDTTGPIETGLEYLDLKPFGLVKASGLRFADLTGDFKGKLDVSLPVTRPLQPGDLKLQAKASLTNVKLRRAINGLSLNSGSIEIAATESLLNVDGDVLVNSVPAKLAWARALGAGSGPSPELRLTARLDATDREQLGILVNHMISGEIPVTIDLAAGAVADGEKVAHIEADLSEAEIVLDTLAWRKPPGEAATAAFDLVAAEKSRTRLEEFRLTGDKVAIRGSIDLGADNKLLSFAFPEFSVNLVTRLAVSGVLRPDKVLAVTARGPYFDGRDFFKSLFSLGQLTAKPLPPSKSTTGLDVTADIETVLGHSQVSLRGVHIEAKRRNGLLQTLEATAGFERGGNVGVRMRPEPGKPRVLQAEADDAGQAFRLIGLYQNLEGGNTSLQVNLDGEGAAEKTGTLWARQFGLLGDPVVKEVLNGATAGDGTGVAERQKFEFDRMRVGFSVGEGQLIIRDMFINGPVVGATMRGRIDYGRQTVNLGGTYIPLFGLNSMFGAVPILGQLLVGRNGEGLLGITFGVQGALAKPEVIVNPVSAVAPGIFRQIFELGPEDPRIQPREPGKANGALAQSSSLPPQTSESQPTDIGEAFPPLTADDPPSILPPPKKKK
jgi:hypothetical protein